MNRTFLMSFAGILLIAISTESGWAQNSGGGRGGFQGAGGGRFAPATRPAFAEQTIPVAEFDDTPLADALESIRKVVPGFNYIVVREAGVPDNYPVLPKMSVKEISLVQFMDFIGNSFRGVSIRQSDGGNSPLYSIQIMNTGGRGGGFGGRRGGTETPPREELGTSVYRLTPIINGMVKNGLAKDSKQAMTDIVSLLQTAVEQADSRTQANLKVHEPTQMLIFKGSEAQQSVLGVAIRNLQPTADELDQKRANEESAKDAEFRGQIERLKSEVVRLQLEVEKARAGH